MLDDHFLKINDSFLSKRKCNSLIKYFKRNMKLKDFKSWQLKNGIKQMKR